MSELRDKIDFEESVIDGEEFDRSKPCECDCGCNNRVYTDDDYCVDCAGGDCSASE